MPLAAAPWSRCSRRKNPAPLSYSKCIQCLSLSACHKLLPPDPIEEEKLPPATTNHCHITTFLSKKKLFFTFFSNITFLSAFLSTFLSVFFVPPNLTPSSFVLSLPSYLKARVPNTNSDGTLVRLTRKLKLSTVHRSQKKVFDKDRNAPILDQQERGRMKLSKSILKSSKKKAVHHNHRQ